MSNLVTLILNYLFYTIISMVIMPLLFLKMYCGLFLLNSFPKFIKDSRSIVDIFTIHFLKVQKSMGDRYIRRFKKYIRKMYSPDTHSHFFFHQEMSTDFWCMTGSFIFMKFNRLSNICFWYYVESIFFSNFFNSHDIQNQRQLLIVC